MMQRAQGAFWLLLAGHWVLLLLFWGLLQLSLASLPSLLLAAVLAVIVPVGVLLIHGSVIGLIREMEACLFSIHAAVRAAVRTTPRLAEALAYGIAVGFFLGWVPQILTWLASVSLPPGVDPWLWSSLTALVRGGFAGLWRYFMWAGFLPAMIFGLTLEAVEQHAAVWRVIRDRRRQVLRRIPYAVGLFLGCSVIFLALPQALLQWETSFIYQPHLEVLLLTVRLGATHVLAGYGWTLAMAMLVTHWQSMRDGNATQPAADNPVILSEIPRG
jgi:hypothetical protein